MTCEQLISHQKEVRKCKLKAAYVLRVRDTREIVEFFCKTHAKKVKTVGYADFYTLEQL